MGYIFTLISFYIIPNVLNLALLGIVCYVLALRLNLVQKPIIIAPQPLWILTGGGDSHSLSRAIFYHKCKLNPC